MRPTLIVQLTVVVALILPGICCRRHSPQSHDWQARAEKAELELASALKALDKARQERDEFEQLLNERTEQLRQMASQLDQSQQALEQAKIEAGRLRQQSNKTDNTVKQLTDRTQALEGQLRDRIAQIQNLERTNKELQQTVSDLTTQLQLLVETVRESRATGQQAIYDANAQ
ncbi:MAG: hypothetical protein QHH07_00545 [Sedimentisphaerales bacterium]|jgi:chromosome segregation ATPase|nr:hypothetical protein [Sedimentisphaerales bacterium]